MQLFPKDDDRTLEHTGEDTVFYYYYYYYYYINICIGKLLI